MSIDLMRMVWESELSACDKAVLLKMADHANDDGDAIYPRKRRIAKWTGYSESAVYGVIRKYLKHGLLAVTEQGGGRGKPTRYCLNVEVLKALPKIDWNDRSDERHDSVRRQNPAPQNPFSFEEYTVSGAGFGPGNPAPGAEKPSTSCTVSDPALLTENRTTKEPSSESDAEEKVAVMFYTTLRELPACRNAGGATAAHVAEAIGEHPDMADADWLDFARWCRDKYLAMPRYAGENTTWAESPSKILRDNIGKWKEKHRPPPPEAERPPITVTVVDDARDRRPSGAPVDCEAYYPAIQKWIPSNREYETGKGRDVRDLSDGAAETVANDLVPPERTDRIERRGMRRAAGQGDKEAS